MFKWFIWFMVGMFLLVGFFVFVENSNDGEKPWDALGIPQGNARISSETTPLPARSVINFDQGIRCEDTTTALECVNTLSGISDTALLNEYLTVDITNPQVFSSGSSVAGTGAISAAYRKWRASSGAVAGGTAFGFFDSGDSAPGYSTNMDFNKLDWAKKIVLVYKLTVPDNTTNGISRLALGKTFSTGVGALAVKGVSLTISNLSLTGECHNGSALTSAGVLMSIPPDYPVWVAVILDGDGTADFYTSTGGTWGSPTSITGCPNSASAATFNFATIESINGIDSAIQQVWVHKFVMAVEQ